MESSAAKATDEPKADAAVEPSDASTAVADEKAAADEKADAEPAADEKAAEGNKPEDKPAEAKKARPTVGVVYEPDDSADGFPLEYGEIIIGLPKQPGSQQMSPSADSSDEYSAEMVSPTSESAAEATPDEQPEEAAARPDDAADTSAATAEEVPAEVAADAPSTHADADEAGTEEGTADAPSTQADADEAGTDEGTVDATGVQVDDTSGEADASPAKDDGAETAPASPGEAGDAEADAVEATASASSADEADRADEAAEVPASAEAAEEAQADGEADTSAEDVKAGDVSKGASAGDGSEIASDSASPDAASESDQAAAETSSDEGAGEADSHEGDSDAAAVDADGKADTEQDAAEDTEGADAAAAANEAADAEDADSAAEDAGAEDADSAAEDAGAEDADSAAEDAGAEDADSDAAAADSVDAGSGSATSDADAEGAEPGAAAVESGDADSDAASDAEVEGAAAAAGAAERAVEQQAAMALITALMKLRGALAASRMPLDVVGADEARQQQKAMLDQLDDYILPRLVQLEAPVLAVVGGSTGAGKSTLVNTLIGHVVSEPGVLRPTTRSPVLIHNPADAEWFVGDRVLPQMARSSGDNPGGMEDPGQLRLVAADTVPRGLAILDAPDIDSVVEANRDLATQLLAAADLWLFVTTAARYADAVPWDFLQSASDRSTAVAVVLDRAPSDTIDDITGHLAQMLLERGLGDSPLFSIKETVVDGSGMLPAETVASIKDWLIDLAADVDARTAVVRRTLHGAVTAMTKKAPGFAKAVRDQADTVADLRASAETAYERAVKDVNKATQDGTLLRGEVLARWQEFVGTGELLKGLQTNVGRLRDKVRSAVVGKPPPTRDLNDAVESGLESLLREHAEAAAERAEESWQSTAPGRQLLAAGDRDLGRMSKEFPPAAGRAVREWQGYVLDLVRQEGADKRSTARILAYGVNGLGLSLMIVIFASTAGLSGAEVGVGAGTAVVGQKLLEAVFGDQAVRTLVAKARENLDDRVHALMDAEFARYLAVLDQHPVDPEAPRQLTEAARAVEDCT
ncbi:hypothetical protein FB561_3824 [Kribbella amoyensis]|uniref:Dynamin family protein n=1 Tax=Kribbella amoyensis TaxID=996641 RepID=A0A561BUU8_9ACTN|nr:hypothetical protein FB561_3824 [Kribbella amoyensis]